MFDHIGFPVRDYARSKAFYQAVLATLGYSVVKEFSLSDDGKDGYAGFGTPQKPQFWIGTGVPLTGRLHVAFVAKDHETVRAFFKAAIEAGAKDNGGPGYRPHYHQNYYAAFVLDPDGHNVEAVCHEPGEFRDQFPD